MAHDDLCPDDILVDSAGRPTPWWEPTPTIPPAADGTFVRYAAVFGRADVTGLLGASLTARERLRRRSQ